MPLQIGLPVTWPDGTLGTVAQDDFKRDQGHDAYLIVLRALRHGAPDICGRLRLTYEAMNRIPGDNDVKKSTAIAVAFAMFVTQHGLTDNFRLNADAPNGAIDFAVLPD